MDDVFYDYSTGELCFRTSDTTAVTSSGEILMKAGDSLAVNLATGELSPVSGWSGDDTCDSTDDDIF